MNGNGMGGNGGGFGGFGGPHGPPLPRRGPFGALAAVAQLPQGQRIGFDPPTPPDLIAVVRRWQGGKKWRRDGTAETVMLPWLAMTLAAIDNGQQNIIHPIDDLCETTDPEDVAHEVWERCKAHARKQDDGLSHHFDLKCFFGDVDGRQTFEVWSSGPLTLPRDQNEWGSTSTAHQTRMLGRGGLGAYPHHASQEIEAMGLALNMMREATQLVVGENRDLRATRDRYQDRELQVIEVFRSIMEDKREHELKSYESEIKMGALKLVAGRMAKIGPVIGLRMSQWVNGKMTGGKPPSEREEMAFSTMKTIALSLKKNGADDFEKMSAAFKMMGIDLDADEKLRDDVIKLMIEFEVDEQTRLATAAAMKDSDVVLEKAEKPGAPTAAESTFEPKKEG